MDDTQELPLWTLVELCVLYAPTRVTHSYVRSSVGAVSVLGQPPTE